MLSQLLAKNLIRHNKQQLVQASSRYFALSNQHLESVLRDPQHANWQQFFSGINPKDVADSDAKQIGTLLKALSFSNENQVAQQQTELYNAIDLYFKQKFRKLTKQEALDIVLTVGSDDSGKKLTGLDGKFWVWETLDEALRPIVGDLNEAETLAILKFLTSNYKGSDDLYDFLYANALRSKASLF